MAEYIFGGIVIAAAIGSVIVQTIVVGRFGRRLDKFVAHTIAYDERQHRGYALHLDGMLHGLLRNANGLEAKKVEIELARRVGFSSHHTHRRGPFPPPAATGKR